MSLQQWIKERKEYIEPVQKYFEMSIEADVNNGQYTTYENIVTTPGTGSDTTEVLRALLRELSDNLGKAPRLQMQRQYSPYNNISSYRGGTRRKNRRRKARRTRHL